MCDPQKQDALNEALAMLCCLHGLICDGPDEVRADASGLYYLLGCVIAKLKLAAT